MKKILFTLLISLSVFSIYGQYTFTNEETGTIITDGSTFIVNQDHFTNHFIVTNNNTFPVKATLDVLNIINTDGSEITICFGFHGQGTCHIGVHTDDSFNSNLLGGTQYLAAGESSGHYDIDFDHIDNTSIATYPKDYVLKLSIINANDNTVVGATTFTYRYDPNGGINNTLSLDDFTINSTQGQLLIHNTYNTSVIIYDFTGKLVFHRKLSAGNHVIPTDLSSGIYIVRATANGKEMAKKLIIR